MGEYPFAAEDPWGFDLYALQREIFNTDIATPQYFGWGDVSIERSDGGRGRPQLVVTFNPGVSVTEAMKKDGAQLSTWNAELARRYPVFPSAIVQDERVVWSPGLAGLLFDMHQAHRRHVHRRSYEDLARQLNEWIIAEIRSNTSPPRHVIDVLRAFNYAEREAECLCREIAVRDSSDLESAAPVSKDHVVSRLKAFRKTFARGIAEYEGRLATDLANRESHAVANPSPRSP